MVDPCLYDDLAGFFSERLNLSVASPEQDLFESGILDSLTFVDLILHLEQEFGIRIAAEELDRENFCSIARIAEFVAAHSGLKRAGAA